MNIDPVIKLIFAALVGFGFKIIWDWFTTGRMEKGKYVTSKHCEEVREKCCISKIKKDVGVMDKEIQMHEKKLDQERDDFALLRDDITKIKEALAEIRTLLKERG